jgi:hypothetical protein
MAKKNSPFIWDKYQVGTSTRYHLYAENYQSQASDRSITRMPSMRNFVQTPWVVERDAHCHGPDKQKYQVLGTGLHGAGCAKSFGYHQTLKSAQDFIERIVGAASVKVDNLINGNHAFLVGDRIRVKERDDIHYKHQEGVLVAIYTNKMCDVAFAYGDKTIVKNHYLPLLQPLAESAAP